MNVTIDCIKFDIADVLHMDKFEFADVSCQLKKALPCRKIMESRVEHRTRFAIDKPIVQGVTMVTNIPHHHLQHHTASGRQSTDVLYNKDY